MNAFTQTAAAVEVPIVLLFTKIDVFEKNLKTIPFSNFFPEYSDYPDSTSILDFFTETFQDLDNRIHGELHVRVVNAADPDDFKKVFENIASTIFRREPIPSAQNESLKKFDEWQSRAYTSAAAENTPPLEATLTSISSAEAISCCEDCQKRVSDIRSHREANRRRHKIDTHWREARLNCPECHMKFGRTDSLQIHLSTIHSIIRYSV